jgi:hypothetical protein
MAGKVGLLGEVAHRRAGLHKARAAIRFDEPRGNFQERRLAGSVASDQARALARPDREFRVREERRAAKSERDVLEVEKRRRNGLNSEKRT